MTAETQFLKRLFAAAVDAVTPARCVPPNLPPPPLGRTVVIGFGKGAAAMARAVEDHWSGPFSGVVVTRYGHGDTGTRRIAVIEASHPLPDTQCLVAADAVLAAVAGLTADDLVICLASGGGSSLLVRPAAGITLDEKRAVTGALLRSGATILEINTVRKHLSEIKGGRLALACRPARVVNLVISDVPGDDASVVACGPTIANHTRSAEARAILAKYRIIVPETIARHLATAAAETPPPDHPGFGRVTTRIIATAKDALAAAAAVAEGAGYETQVLGDAIEGEARQVAIEHAGLARKVAATGQPGIILSGGETSVTVTGPGRGGRNCEYLLALALALDGHSGIHALAADTDGIDGSEDNAGAVIGPDSLIRARALGLDPAAILAENDSYSLFAALGDLVMTGPTRTNVNDFRAILIR